MESKLIPCDDRTCKCSDSYGICRADEPCRKPPMTTSEPTTGEMIERLRIAIDQGTERVVIPSAGVKMIADRLESQERELSGITGELERFRAFHERYAEQTSKKYVDDICALTARAEQAERERDAAFAVIGIQAEKLKESHVVLCNICEFEDMIGCVHKSHCDGYQLFKWRGQPQDGDGL